jgi:energy-coupling factor transporter ATP-binding protein EcfA2
VSTATTSPAATIRAVTYHYPAAESAALRDVSMDVEPGLTVIAGPSGGGKSTLLRLLNGLVPHFHGGRISGAVRVGELDALRTSTALLARDVGFVFQDPEAQFVRTIVEDEVAFSLENTSVPAARIRPRVEEAMAAAGVLSLAGRAVATLSGGERQRVAIASALALNPRILVLDEPTAQLDPGGASTVVEACVRVARSGTRVVVSEHRVDRLLDVTDRLGVMTEGRLAGLGPVRAMLGELVDPPQLVQLGRLLGWGPVQPTIETAAALAPSAGPAPAGPPPALPGDAAWELRRAVIGHGPQPLLEGFDLAGASGEIVVLMGPNGGGKTTLLRSIAGLHRPTSGSAWRRFERVAYLPQDPGVLLHRRSVRAEVEYTLARCRSSEPPTTVLGGLGLAAIAERYPGDLSSGQRQRAALAAILAGGPPLVLLDEPTRGMDGSARETLTAMLRELAARGTAVVVATHDADLAARLADRVVIIGDGTAREAGRPAEALSGNQPYATDIGRLYPGGPVTVSELLQRLGRTPVGAR